MSRVARGTALGVAVVLWASAAWSVPAAQDKPAARLIPAEPAAIRKAIEAAGGRAVLVNIWASWCIPCRQEFDDVLKVRRDLAGEGLKVILVSADFDDARDDAVRFLSERGVDFPSYVKVGRDEDFIATLAPEWSGVLPSTLIYDGRGRLAKVLEGKQTYQSFHDQVVRVITQGRKGP